MWRGWLLSGLGIFPTRPIRMWVVAYWWLTGCFTSILQDLKEVFEKFGDVGDVFIPTDRESGRPRGFAFVRFYNKKDAEVSTICSLGFGKIEIIKALIVSAIWPDLSNVVSGNLAVARMLSVVLRQTDTGICRYRPQFRALDQIADWIQIADSHQIVGSNRSADWSQIYEASDLLEISDQIVDNYQIGFVRNIRSDILSIFNKSMWNQ